MPTMINRGKELIRISPANVNLYKCKMNTQFVINPTEDVVLDVDKLYGIKHGIIQVGVEDLKAVIDNANNVIMLEGKAKGNLRVINAIEDAVLKTCSVAKDYNLFSADKVLLQIVYGKEQPMLLAEAADVIPFADMFSHNTSFVWGVNETDESDGFLTVKIMASNLKPSI